MPGCRACILYKGQLSVVCRNVPWLLPSSLSVVSSHPCILFPMWECRTDALSTRSLHSHLHADAAVASPSIPGSSSLPGNARRTSSVSADSAGPGDL